MSGDSRQAASHEDGLDGRTRLEGRFDYPDPLGREGVLSVTYARTPQQAPQALNPLVTGTNPTRSKAHVES